MVEAPASAHVIEPGHLLLTTFIYLFVQLVDLALCRFVLLVRIRAKCVRAAEVASTLRERCSLIRHLAFRFHHAPYRLCHMKSHISLVVRALHFRA